jgi:hypothetical protein
MENGAKFIMVCNSCTLIEALTKVALVKINLGLPWYIYYGITVVYTMLYTMVIPRNV